MKSGARALWPWQIFGTIHAVATTGELFCLVINARFYRFPVSQISQNLSTTTSIDETVKILEENFENFTLRGRFSNRTQNSSTNFTDLRL